MPPMVSSSKPQVEDTPLDAERADAAARKARRATRLFKIGTELAYKAPTFCETMRNIVGLREAVFLQQRKFVKRVGLQRESRKMADELCASSANIVLRANFAAYERFCAIADAPVFPITHAMLALAMPT
ncbi:uncharacterized protein JCM10292_001288 [Rhodotorula paludigena]|uniref:uncharacterized protein n=1 Tax=Rhodotorula paludigena TaxID=86838 RepID=UPI00317ECFA5